VPGETERPEVILCGRPAEWRERLWGRQVRPAGGANSSYYGADWLTAEKLWL
jgi:hypothetical protein